MKEIEKEKVVLVMLLYVGIVLNINFAEFVHITIRWHCFKHKFCRICLDTDGTKLVPFPYGQEHANEKWLFKKEELFLI